MATKAIKSINARKSALPSLRLPLRLCVFARVSLRGAYTPLCFRVFRGPGATALGSVTRFLLRVMSFFLLRRCTRLFERSTNEIITRSRAVDERKHMKIRGALAYHFDFALILQARQLAHHIVLLRDAH